jgi:hypothetical protein
LAAATRSIAFCLAALLLATGCDGESEGGSEAGGQGTAAEARRVTPARVEAGLKARLESGIASLAVQSVDCARQGRSYTCQVDALAGGQRRSGDMTLAADRTGRRFMARGKLAGTGGHVSISGLIVDVDRPVRPRRPATSLKQQIKVSIQERDPQFLVRTVSCPGGGTKRAGGSLECTARGVYGVHPASAALTVTQTDDAGRAYGVTGKLVIEDPAGRRRGSFRNIRVALP